MEGERADGSEMRSLIRGVIDEFVQAEQAKAEPAYKAELLDERKRREELERRVNELVQESARSREKADEAERNSSIRAELQRLGVAKVDLAYKAIKDDVRKREDGELVARSGPADVPLRDYLKQFVQENPELLPARITGGSGMGPAAKVAATTGTLDLDKIRPGMNPEELERIRQEVARVASQALRGL